MVALPAASQGAMAPPGRIEVIAYFE